MRIIAMSAYCALLAGCWANPADKCIEQRIHDATILKARHITDLSRPVSIKTTTIEELRQGMRNCEIRHGKPTISQAVQSAAVAEAEKGWW